MGRLHRQGEYLLIKEQINFLHSYRMRYVLNKQQNMESKFRGGIFTEQAEN